MKEKPNPNYHMGKETGYELINGEYHIAPMYWAQFDRLRDERAGISDMLAMVTRHANSDLAKIAKAQNELWARIAEDIGVDITKGYTYWNGVVKPQEPPKEAQQ